MQFRLLLAVCLLSLPAAAQHKPADNTPAPSQTRSTEVPKGRQPAMERHTRTTWRYHSGPKRTRPADSNATRTQKAADAGK